MTINMKTVHMDGKPEKWSLETLFPKNKNKNADHNICKEVSLQFLNRFRYSLEQI